MVSITGGEEVAAVVAAYKVEVVRFIRLQSGINGAFSGVSDRSRREAWIEIGIVG
jgi:hypothetical protein